MAKEDGAWQPATVNRDIWIPALEESLARAPQWRRYQRLGTLYWHEANVSEEVNETSLRKAELAYLASLKRHASNPIPKINLAIIHAQAGKWQKADRMYASASEMARARERWFRMHSYWARMHQDWAVDLWRKEKPEQVEEHFSRAKELYKLSSDYANFYQNKQWGIDYTQLLITHAGFLDSQKKYIEAEKLFDEARQQGNWYNRQVDTKLNFYYAMHLYEQGRDFWYQRKAKQAYELMKKAKSQLLQHKRMMKNDVEAGYGEQMGKVQGVIDFLENTGVKK